MVDFKNQDLRAMAREVAKTSGPLAKATSAGGYLMIPLEGVGLPGLYFVESKTTPGSFYVTGARICVCPGFVMRHDCSHSKAVRALTPPPSAGIPLPGSLLGGADGIIRP